MRIGSLSIKYRIQRERVWWFRLLNCGFFSWYDFFIVLIVDSLTLGLQITILDVLDFTGLSPPQWLLCAVGMFEKGKKKERQGIDGKGKKKKNGGSHLFSLSIVNPAYYFQLLPFNESRLENFVWTDKPPYLIRPPSNSMGLK